MYRIFLTSYFKYLILTAIAAQYLWAMCIQRLKCIHIRTEKWCVWNTFEYQRSVEMEIKLHLTCHFVNLFAYN